jgi:hypothetical protein
MIGTTFFEKTPKDVITSVFGIQRIQAKRGWAADAGRILSDFALH